MSRVGRQQRQPAASFLTLQTNVRTPVMPVDTYTPVPRLPVHGTAESSAGVTHCFDPGPRKACHHAAGRTKLNSARYRSGRLILLLGPPFFFSYSATPTWPPVRRRHRVSLLYAARSAAAVARVPKSGSQDIRRLVHLTFGRLFRPVLIV